MRGVWLSVGVLAFGVMALGDWLDLKKRPAAGQAAFGAGCLLLTAASIALPGTEPPAGPARPMFWGAAALMLGLLVYTVFGAVRASPPAAEGMHPLVSDGVYALCRHPGVWWLAGGYFLLWCADGRRVWLEALGLFGGADAVYVLWQDRLVFPRRIENYRAYQKSTPFLLPTRRSIRRCWQTLGASRRKNKEG